MVIYFHTDLGSFDRGPINPLRLALVGNDMYLVTFIAIHMGWWTRVAISNYFESCSATAVRGGVSYSFYESIVDYLRTIDTQP